MTADDEGPGTVSFSPAWRGYDRAEVDAFVAEVARRLREHDDFQRAGTEVASALRSLHGSVLEIRNGAEDEARRILAAAEEQARDERAAAEVDARAALAAAEEQAQRIRSEAETAVAALRVEAEDHARRSRSDADAMHTEARERHAEAERLLREAVQACDATRGEADRYAEGIRQSAAASARAHALAALQDVRDDLARLVRERDVVRQQLQELREAIATVIATAATRSVDLTEGESEEVDGPPASPPASPPDDALVDEIVDRAVQEARPDRTTEPDGGPSPTVGRLAF
jgi:DivIVA domain-containing protein